MFQHDPPKAARRRLWACIVIVVIPWGLLPGQSMAKEAPSARIAHYNSDNGLPQNTISMMSFDPEGNLWIGTQGGLVRFNGHDFSDLSSDLKNPRMGILQHSLSDTLRLTDGNNNLYIINPANGKVEQRESPVNNPLFFFAKYVLEHNNIDEQSFPSYSDFSIKTEIRILHPSKSAYIVGAAGNLFYLTPEKVSIVATDVLHVLGNRDMACAMLHSGKIYALQDGKVTHQRLVVSIDSSIEQPGDFWENAYFINGVASSYAVYKGIFYQLSIEADRLSIHPLLKGLPSIRYLEHAVYDEKNQVLALGTGTDGVYVITQAYFSTYLITSPSISLDSVEEGPNNIYSLAEWGDGSILAENGVVYSKDIRSIISSDSISRYFLHRDKQGRFWTAKDQKNIVIRDQSFRIIYDWTVGGHTHSMLEMSDGKFVLNKNDTLLLLRIDDAGPIIEKKIPTQVNFIPGKLHKISDHQICLFSSQGIYVVDLNTGKSHIKPGTKGIYFREVVDMPGGYKWLGTYGNGFFLNRGDSLMAMPLDAKKHLRFTHTFLPDSSGFLWISTNKGLFKVRESDLLAYADQKTDYVYYHYFDKTYGFYTNEFNGGGMNSGLITRKGDFYFASMQGLVQFRPSDFEVALPSGNLTIEKITVDDTVYYAPYNEISIPPGFERISVRVNLPYFGHRANRQIFYRIQGLDANWRPIPAENLIEIPNISSGEYTLELKKINGFGINNYSISQINFEVRPHYYEQLGFRALVLLLIIIIAFIILRKRVRRLEQTNQLLEEKVSARTAALETAFRDISHQKESLIKNQEVLQTIFQVVVHDLSSPLRFLQRISGRIRKNLHSASFEDISEDVQTMHSSAIQAELLTTDLLTWLKARQESTDFRKVLLSPNEIAQKNLALYHWIAEDKGIVIEHKAPFSPDKIEVYEDLVGVLLRNCLDNAIKYTKKGSIHLSLYEQAGILHLVVADTGIGIDEIAVKQINSGLIPYRLQQDKHLGMRLIFDVLQQLNGTMKIESELGKGTRVHISFPVDAHNSITK
jgi:signal transduction histidine kinase